MDTERLKGKVVIVTGANAGIGAAMVKVLVDAGMMSLSPGAVASEIFVASGKMTVQEAEKFVKHNKSILQCEDIANALLYIISSPPYVNVVGFARRVERIDLMAKELVGKPGKLYAVRVDLTKEVDIVHVFNWVSENVGPVHILVNNAGVSVDTDIINGDTQKWKLVMDTNIHGPATASREAIKIMRAHRDNGQIINVNSIAGRKCLNVPKTNVYPASKHALTAFTETLRLDLIRAGSKIRVTNLSPGLVASDFFTATGRMTVEDAENFVKNHKSILQCEDIANALMYIISSPPSVNVVELTIRPVGETF